MFFSIFPWFSNLMQRLIAQIADTTKTSGQNNDDDLAGPTAEQVTYTNDLSTTGWASIWPSLFGTPTSAPTASPSDPVPVDVVVETPPAPEPVDVVTPPAPQEPDPVDVVAEAPAPTPDDTAGEPVAPIAPEPVEVVVTPPTTPEQDPVPEDNTGGPGPIVEDVTPDVPVVPVVEEEEQAPEPVAETPPADTPETGGDTTGNNSAPTLSIMMETDGTAMDVSAGRVATFELPDSDSITNVTITNMPDVGNVTVNPDFSISLVLSGTDYDGALAFDYTVTRDDGSVENLSANLDVAPLTQAAGWGFGDHYMLETDADGKMVIETGDNHRKVYVSESEEALSRADIAAREGIDEGVITTTWLRNNPEYGGSEGMALATELGMELWYGMHGWREEPSSNWLMFERGYDYSDLGQIVGRELQSESELHPTHITSWGEGSRPVLDTQVKIWQKQTDNVVFTELEVTGSFLVHTGDNILLSDMVLADKITEVRDAENFTLRNSEVVDAVSGDPGDAETWSGKTQGLIGVNTDGILLENNIFHHNGWQEDYLVDGSTEGGMAPNMYNHNVYLQYDTTDVTFRDNITSQSSSFGAHLRGGAFVENNLFLDNNVAVSLVGGNYKDFGFVGNFTIFMDNVVTSGGYKLAPRDGASAWGVLNTAQDTTMLNNIIAHLANPDDSDEALHKTLAQMAMKSEAGGSLAYDDTIILNWAGSERNGTDAADQNTEGLDIATAMATTIQRYAADFLDVPISEIAEGVQKSGYYESKLITDLMEFLLAERDANGSQIFSVDDIIDYFQAGFDIAAQDTGDTHHVFVPNALGGGVRWDNHLNWTSDALPEDGDTVDLNGNWVNFSDTVAIDSLDLGTGGKLQVGSGKLTTDNLETGDDSAVFVERAGQFWTDGYDGDAHLSVQATGGRFANTGDFNGPATVDVSGGQAILGADDAQFTLGADSELRIEGSDVKVGFDGETGGVATLNMQDDGQLSFVADADGISVMKEFRSGAFDQEGSNVNSGTVLDGTLAIDLSDHVGTGSMKLIELDAIAGMFDEIDIHGLGGNRDAVVTIDYTTDIVTLELSNGTGQGDVVVTGDPNFGGDENAALWEKLTGNLNEGQTQNSSITIFDEAIEALPDISFI